MHYVYILHSEKLNRFYVGQTHNVETRLEHHNNDYYNDKWSTKGKPWVLFLCLELETKQLALAVEQHIKTMKSKKYIENLKNYPSIVDKLKIRFSTNC